MLSKGKVRINEKKNICPTKKSIKYVQHDITYLPNDFSNERENLVLQPFWGRRDSWVHTNQINNTSPLKNQKVYTPL